MLHQEPSNSTIKDKNYCDLEDYSYVHNEIKENENYSLKRRLTNY